MRPTPRSVYKSLGARGPLTVVSRCPRSIERSSDPPGKQKTSTRADEISGCCIDAFEDVAGGCMHRLEIFSADDAAAF